MRSPKACLLLSTTEVVLITPRLVPVVALGTVPNMISVDLFYLTKMQVRFAFF